MHRGSRILVERVVFLPGCWLLGFIFFVGLMKGRILTLYPQQRALGSARAR